MVEWRRRKRAKRIGRVKRVDLKIRIAVIVDHCVAGCVLILRAERERKPEICGACTLMFRGSEEEIHFVPKIPSLSLSSFYNSHIIFPPFLPFVIMPYYFKIKFHYIYTLVSKSYIKYNYLKKNSKYVKFEAINNILEDLF